MQTAQRQDQPEFGAGRDLPHGGLQADGEEPAARVQAVDGAPEV